jgi:beta-lactamase regulating signal transducer with metallopeptidase domain
MSFVNPVFTALAAQSWKIGCLICALGILRWTVRGRIPQQIIFSGWIIIAVALLVPVSLSETWVVNAVQSRPHPGVGTTTDIAIAAASQKVVDDLSFPSPIAAFPILSTPRLAYRWPRLSTIVVVWLLGIAALLSFRAAAWIRFRQGLARSVGPMNPQYLAAVSECAELLQVTSRVSVLVTDAAGGPAMGGLFRPYLLLPSSLERSLSAAELRLVILHELGHWRRRDTIANFLVQCALIVHWFNPAVWLFARMACLDCEFACDEFVLGRMGAAEPQAYGSTILKVLATGRRRSAPPACSEYLAANNYSNGGLT